MLWELPVMYGVLSVHLEVNVQNKRLLYLLPILDFDPGTHKKAQGMPARWKAWNQFSRPLQSRLLVAGGGHPRARQGKSLVPLLSTPFLSSHRGTVPYLSRFQFCAGRYTNSQAGHTHTHTHTLCCGHALGLMPHKMLSGLVLRGEDGDDRQTRQKVDDNETPNLRAVTCLPRSQPSIPKRRRNGLDVSSVVREGVDETKSPAASPPLWRFGLGPSCDAGGLGCPVHG